MLFSAIAARQVQPRPGRTQNSGRQGSGARLSVGLTSRLIRNYPKEMTRPVSSVLTIWNHTSVLSLHFSTCWRKFLKWEKQAHGPQSAELGDTGTTQACSWEEPGRACRSQRCCSADHWGCTLIFLTISDAVLASRGCSDLPFLPGYQLPDSFSFSRGLGIA